MMMMMMMMPKVNGNSHRKGSNAPGKTKFGRFWNGSHTGCFSGLLTDCFLLL